MSDIATALVDAGVAKEKRNTVDRSVSSYSVMELSELLGAQTRAADALGLTSSGVATIISRGTCSRTVAILAAQLIATHGEIHNKPARLLVVRVNEAKREALTSVMVAMNIKWSDFADG